MVLCRILHVLAQGLHNIGDVVASMGNEIQLSNKTTVVRGILIKWRVASLKFKMDRERSGYFVSWWETRFFEQVRSKLAL